MSPASDSPDSPEVLARVAEGMALLEPLARQLRIQLSAYCSVEDLASLGHEGVLVAARTYDKQRGVPFDRWVTVKARGTMLEGLRGQGEVSRRLYKRLRGLKASNEAEEGLIEEDASTAPPTPEAADARLTAYLMAMATSLALGSLTVHDDSLIDAVEDERGTVEEQTLREELKAQVRAAIAERPPQERELLERYYFEGKTLAEASGGLSRGWSSRLLAQATLGVAKALKRANVDP